MKIEFSKRYIRSYKKLDKRYQSIIKDTIIQLQKDFSHPSLRVKKMGGYRNPYIWECSGNMDMRITFEIEKPDIIILRNCGHHDDTLNNP